MLLAQTSTTLLWIAGIAALLGGVAWLFRWATTDHLINRTFREAAEGDFDAATQRLRAAASSDDPRGRRYDALGFLYFQRSRWNEAAEAFGKAFELDPVRILRRVYQAHSMARGGKVDEARALLLAMAEQRPEDVTPLCGLGMLLIDVGDTGAAAEYYWKARQLAQQHPGMQTPEGLGLMEACADAIDRAAVPATASSPPPTT